MDARTHPPEAGTETAAAALSRLGSDRERGLFESQASERLAQEGPNEVAEAKRSPLTAFARRFSGVSAWMIELIVVLSFALGETTDAIVAIALLVVNAGLATVEERRAQGAVEALRARLSVTSRVRRDGRWRPVESRALVRGDVVRLRGGDLVPADAILLEGALSIDASALTGESSEVEAKADAPVSAGSTVRRGEATAVVVEIGEATEFGRTTHLVGSAHPRLHVERTIGRLTALMLAVVAALVGAAAALALARGHPLAEVLPLSLVLLMSAVPVALPAMLTVSAAVGAKRLARRGVLVTRLAAVEDAASMDVLCADKTGTLTRNRPRVARCAPHDGSTEDDVLETGALASVEADQDPIDRAFLTAARERGLAQDAVRVSFTPFTPETRRTEAVVEIGGKRVRAVKGALETVARLAGLGPEDVAALDRVASEEAAKGMRAIAVARGEEGADLRLVGLALLEDEVRGDSKALIAELRSLGVHVKMLTGDALPAALEVGRSLGLPRIVRADGERAPRPPSDAAGPAPEAEPDGLAQVTPEGKYRFVERLQAQGHVVGMTGDGVNDAPALKQAEVGIAVRGATDVAKRAAGAVLVDEGLQSMVALVEEGRAVHARVLAWVRNKVSRTVLKAGFVVVAFLATGRFVVSSSAMMLLVFLTDFAKVALATDRVEPEPSPAGKSLARPFAVGAAVGVLLLVEALAMLALAWRPLSLADHPALLKTFGFETLLFLALFSIVSVRERRAFWSSRPSGTLVAALAADAVVGVAIGLFGLDGLAPMPVGPLALVVVLSAAGALGPNDVVKRLLRGREPRERERR